MKAIRRNWLAVFILLGIAAFPFFFTYAADFQVDVQIMPFLADCPNSACDNNETCSSCPADCGVCPATSTPTPAQTTLPPGGGGGGGGGGGTISIVTQAVFKGMAYPLSKVTLLKDGQIAASTQSGPDAKFEIGLSGLSPGAYTFGVWAEDAKGEHSITHTFSIYVSFGATTVISGIFLPPTISLDKTEVKRGDILNILGYSTPNAEITVVINSETEIIKKMTAQDNGAWLYKFDTLEVEKGDHNAKSRAAKDGDITPFSQTVAFKVGQKNIAAPSKLKKGDLNGDNKVNLLDFSIAAYWYKRTLSEAAKELEKNLNDDGKIDIKDFSILAYYWTG